MLRFLTAGESHGPTLTGILDGIPAGLPLTAAEIDADLARRQQGYGKGGRMSIEKDHVRFSAGVVDGHTTGAPIALLVDNRDYKNWADKVIEPMTIPRPGHADLTSAVKYGYRELRLGLERSSARETTMRVAVGAICKKFLAEFGIRVQGYVAAIGNVVAPLDQPGKHIDGQPDYLARFEAAESNDVRCPDPESAEQMHAAIRSAIQDKDTLGGIIEAVVLNAPAGLGSHVQYDRKLDALLMAAVGSIQAIKGVEIGHAFEQSLMPGTKVHDEILVEDGILKRHTNRAGGVEGGISTGEPIIVRAAMKPIATTLNPLQSVDLASGNAKAIEYERSDFCPVPRGVPVVESMVAIVIAGALLEKLGGDSIAEMRPRFETLRRNRLEDLPMDNRPWGFRYEYS